MSRALSSAFTAVALPLPCSTPEGVGAEMVMLRDTMMVNRKLCMPTYLATNMPVVNVMKLFVFGW
jgi:hypothetical protein